MLRLSVWGRNELTGGMPAHSAHRSPIRVRGVSVGRVDLTEKNLALMEKGRPPIGGDGLQVELHHRNQNPLGPLDEMTSTTHDTIPHPITPSQIDRGALASERSRYWVTRARELLGQ
jgi:hypothetical protein